MTRKHYSMMAREINNLAHAAGDNKEKLAAYMEVISVISHAMKLDNPNFDRLRFMKACMD